MNVVFFSPSYPPEMIQYTRGLAEVGAKVYGVGDTPREALPKEVRPYLHDYLQVPRIMDEDDVIARTTSWMKGKTVDRVLANWEVLVMLAARLRAQWGLPGMTPGTVHGFRDKQLMKERVAAAGLRVPRSVRVKTEKEVTYTRPDQVPPELKKMIIDATHQSSYTDTVTLKDAFEAVDQGEFVVRYLKDEKTGEKLISVDYGAGDNTYGGIFSANGKLAARIHDGDLEAR